MAVLKKTYSPTLFRMVFLVEKDSDGMRLDAYIGHKNLPFSRELVKKKIISGEIKIEGREGRQRPASRIRCGEKIVLSSYKKDKMREYWNGKEIDLESLRPSLLFEDDDICVISCPPFMLTHPTGGHLFHCATLYCEEKYGQRIHSIHRLDRETSGILILGKNPSIAQRLTREFENRRVKKAYFFIAKKNQHYHGKTYFEERASLAPMSLDEQRVAVISASHGKTAHTLFVVIEDIGGYVLGLAFPYTGRQHQIRVHSMLNGLPLVGDKLYLGNFETFQRFKDRRARWADYDLMEIPRHALHAIFLQIHYKGKLVSFLDTISKDLKDWSKLHSIDLNNLEDKMRNVIQGVVGDSSKLL